MYIIPKTKRPVSATSLTVKSGPASARAGLWTQDRDPPAPPHHHRQEVKARSCHDRNSFYAFAVRTVSNQSAQV